jgi:hypothetical protein
MADSDVEVRVAERLASARASDNLKATSLAEVQRKLRIEFEDSYAQRLQREARDKRELGDKLVQALSRVDVLTSEQKTLLNALEVRDGVVRALEHRCASLEKLKHHLKSYRNLVRYMSARVFVNTVRLKRSLHQVHDSLRGLADKLAENAEYDRSSNLILPQHELEQWLRRTEKLVKQPKVAVTPMTAMAATNVNVTVSGGGGNAGGPTAAQANGTDKATTSKGKGKLGAKPGAAAPTTAAGPTANNSVAAVAAAALAGGASAVVPPSAPPSVAQVRSRRATRAAVTYPNLSVSDGSGGGSGHMALFNPFGSSSSSSRPRGAYTHPLRFGAMLSCLGEVETVLRGCLVECLAKAGEWKGACEDFFLRNQDLLAERDQAREMHKQAQEQVAQLQAALAVLQRGLAAGSGSEEQRKALLIADAAAASVAGNNTTSNSNAAALLSAGESSVGAASASASLLNASVGKSGGGGNASSSGAATAGGAEVKGVQQALSMLEAHAHTARLAATDATRARDVARLSAADLAELSRAPHRASRSNHAQTPAPRGFFDHRDALVQACMMHKLDLEKTKKSNRELRTQNEVLREALRQARLSAQHGLPALMPAGQQQQQLQQHAEQYSYAQQQQQQQQYYQQQQQEEQKESPVSSHAATPSSSSQQQQHARPNLSQLDVEDTLPVRNIRPLIPFSPPVHPVSPWTGVSPAAAAAATAAASTSSRPVSRESAGGARTYLANNNSDNSPYVAPFGRSVVPSTPASARTVPSSPYTTLPYRPGTAGGGAPLSARPATGKGALAHTQPISTASPVVITTASSSYASTPVYTPLVGTPTPHASNKAAEKVYGAATMHGVLSDMAIPALARPRTSSGVGARVSAALAAQNKALQTTSAASGVGVVGVITGDLSYDIISPYMAQPLPWERRPATAGSGGHHYNAVAAAAASTGHGSPRQQALAASVARRQKAAQYGRQIKEQHAAQAAAREREESAYRHSAFERPFQSQTGTAATTPHHRHHADGAGSAVPFDLDVPLIPAPVTPAEAMQAQRRANNHLSPTIAPAPAPPSSSSSSSVRGRPGSAARSRVLTSAAGALPSPMAAPVASSAGSSSSSASSSATSSSSSAAPSRPMSGHSTTMSPRMATKPNNPPAAATTSSPPSAFQFNTIAAASSSAVVPAAAAPQPHSPAVPDYRSIRTGGAVGQRPHAQTGPGMLQQPLQGFLATEGHDQEGREVSYGDTPFDRSPSRSQSRTHHPAPLSSSAHAAQFPAGIAAAGAGVGAAANAAAGGGGDDDEYEEDFS